MSLPIAERVREESFSEEVEFPFTFDEIRQIEFQSKLGSVELNPNMDAIRSLFPVAGLKAEFRKDLIVVVADDLGRR